jgi:hypothetical protein
MMPVVDAGSVRATTIVGMLSTSANRAAEIAVT